MTQQRRIKPPTKVRRRADNTRDGEQRQHGDGPRRVRAALDYDRVLEPRPGDTETIGAAAERPELDTRQQANEDYVKTFRQAGGE